MLSPPSFYFASPRPSLSQRIALFVYPVFLASFLEPVAQCCSDFQPGSSSSRASRRLRCHLYSVLMSFHLLLQTPSFIFRTAAVLSLLPDRRIWIPLSTPDIIFPLNRTSKVCFIINTFIADLVFQEYPSTAFRRHRCRFCGTVLPITNRVHSSTVILFILWYYAFVSSKLSIFWFYSFRADLSSYFLLPSH